MTPSNRASVQEWIDANAPEVGIQVLPLDYAPNPVEPLIEKLFVMAGVNSVTATKHEHGTALAVQAVAALLNGGEVLGHRASRSVTTALVAADRGKAGLWRREFNNDDRLTVLEVPVGVDIAAIAALAAGGRRGCDGCR
jgi:hypothetical protein